MNIESIVEQIVGYFNKYPKVKDKVTGFKGIATGFRVYQNGCVQILVEAGMAKDGKLEEFWFDIQRLNIKAGNFKRPGGVRVAEHRKESEKKIKH